MMYYWPIRSELAMINDIAMKDKIIIKERIREYTYTIKMTFLVQDKHFFILQF